MLLGDAFAFRFPLVGLFNTHCAFSRGFLGTVEDLLSLIWEIIFLDLSVY